MTSVSGRICGMFSSIETRFSTAREMFASKYNDPLDVTFVTLLCRCD